MAHTPRWETAAYTWLQCLLLALSWSMSGLGWFS